MDSFLIRVVVSRYSVSLGGSLWKTTLEIDDLPLLEGNQLGNVTQQSRVTHLRWPMSRRRGFPSPALLLGRRPVWKRGGTGSV